MISFKFTFLILFFSHFNLFSSAQTLGGKPVDCNLLSAYLFDAEDALLYANVNFNYTTNIYYNFTLNPLDSSITVGLIPSNTTGWTEDSSYLVNVWLNDQPALVNSKEFLFQVNDILTVCNSTNHFIFELFDEYALYVNIFGYSIRARYDSCRFRYELFLYNPPCLTVPLLYG